MSEIVNKVKQSKLETVDLEKIVGDVQIRELDLKDFLFQEMILKEKDFREKTDAFDWNAFSGCYATVHCSTDAIIPKWAYMIIAQYLKDIALDVLFGTKDEVTDKIFEQRLNDFDWASYDGKFVLLKGCSKMDVSPSVYMHATKKLLPYAEKLMYGEACSNVPVYRKKKETKA
jgi:hypothetical protein